MRNLIVISVSLLAASGSAFGDDTRNCDLERGKKLYSKCSICHTNDDSGQHGAGPNLHAIVGREKGTAPGFLYSIPMSEQSGVWTVEALDEFITNPAAMVPGTTKAFAGIRSAEDRKEIICYLQFEHTE